MKKCDVCSQEKTTSTLEYNPMQVITGQLIGWFSGKDGSEICGPCMTNLLNNQ